MNFQDWIVAVFFALLIGVSTFVVLHATDAFASEPSVFSVTDPARGLYNMHPALLNEETRNG